METGITLFQEDNFQRGACGHSEMTIRNEFMENNAGELPEVIATSGSHGGLPI